MAIVQIDIKEQYIDELNDFMNSLPSDAMNKSLIVKKNLDMEVKKRVEEYQAGNLATIPFAENLGDIREKIVSQL